MLSTNVYFKYDHNYVTMVATKIITITVGITATVATTITKKYDCKYNTIAQIKQKFNSCSFFKNIYFCSVLRLLKAANLVLSLKKPLLKVLVC